MISVKLPSPLFLKRYCFGVAPNLPGTASEEIKMSRTPSLSISMVSILEAFNSIVANCSLSGIRLPFLFKNRLGCICFPFLNSLPALAVIRSIKPSSFASKNTLVVFSFILLASKVSFCMD